MGSPPSSPCFTHLSVWLSGPFILPWNTFLSQLVGTPLLAVLPPKVMFFPRLCAGSSSLPWSQHATLCSSVRLHWPISSGCMALNTISTPRTPGSIILDWHLFQTNSLTSPIRYLPSISHFTCSHGTAQSSHPFMPPVPAARLGGWG